MSSTRFSHAPMQIYQDTFDQAPMPIMSPFPAYNDMALQPMKATAPRRNPSAHPQQQAYVHPTALKPLRPSQAQAQAPAPFSQFNNMIPMPTPTMGPAYYTDSMQKRQPLQAKFPAGPQKATFSTYIPMPAMGKENFPQHSFAPCTPQISLPNDAPHKNPLSDVHLAKKPSLKRSLMEAAPITESQPVKRARIAAEPKEPRQEDTGASSSQVATATDSFPDLVDDGQKPSHSYAQLIGMAIMRSPRRKLTLAQIYKWISDTYSFYSKEEATGWQNSIRHNLSLNKAFVKQERPKDDPGKGNYWAILSGMEQTFVKEKPVKKPGLGESVTMTTESFDQGKESRSSCAPQSPASDPASRAPVKAVESSPTIVVHNMSSDATIPESDIDADGQYEAERGFVVSSPFLRSSPPMANLQSSPPVVSRGDKHDTPPSLARLPASSANHSVGHKRKYASMDDSGYISSLDSSAMRKDRPASRKGADADRAKVKRGRAEAEIARLRGSSYDSPTRARSFANMVPPNSSPMRIPQSPQNKMLPPLTPIVKFKAPKKPPPSVSPNTNLRMHRAMVQKLVGSPLRDVLSIDDPFPYSPQFDLEASKRLFEEYKQADAVSSIDYQSLADQFWFPMTSSDQFYGESPLRSAISRRRSPERPKSVSALADITAINTNFNRTISSLINTPTFKLTPAQAASQHISPTKRAAYMESPIKSAPLAAPAKISPAINFGQFALPSNDLYQTMMCEDIGDTTGVDLMNPFPKIGAGAANGSHTRQPSKGSVRPGLGRSATSRF